MRVAAIISCLLLGYSANTWSDLRIRYDHIGNNQQQPMYTLLIKQDRVRIDSAADASQSVMIDLKSGDIVQVHAQSRRYFRINAQTINQYANFYQRNKSMLQGLIDHGLQQLSAQKRDQVSQLINDYEQGSKSLKQLSVRPSGKNDLVLGAGCSFVGIHRQDKLQRELCISSYQQLGLDSGDVQSLEQLKVFVQQFRQSAPRDKQEILQLLTSALGELNGLPMKIVNYYPNGRVRNVIQAASISFRAIPDQAYRIPDNYQEQNVPLL